METFTFIVQSALLNMDIVMYILLGTLVIAVLASVLFRFCKLSNILIFANTVTIFAIGVLFIILYYIFSLQGRVEHIANYVMKEKGSNELLVTRLGTDNFQLENDDSVFVYKYKIICDSICIVNLDIKCMKSER